MTRIFPPISQYELMAPHWDILDRIHTNPSGHTGTYAWGWLAVEIPFELDTGLVQNKVGKDGAPRINKCLRLYSRVPQSMEDLKTHGK